MDSSPTATTSAKPAKTTGDPTADAANAAKYREYEKDYVRWIHQKYFSSEVPGVNEPVYENAMPIEGFVIKATKNPPLKSFSESKISLESSPNAGGAGESPAQAGARKKQARR